MALEQDRVIRRILRVNHSGEHGAVAIYKSQIQRAEKHYPDILPWLKETLSHEVRHRDAFLSAMQPRNAKPCRALYVWKYGGAFLGGATALFGRLGVMVCTSAVERTVHRHLTEQIDFLDSADKELSALVRDVLQEEEQHLAEADRQHDPSGPLARILSYIVAASTEVLIFVSTRGDSLRLRSTIQVEENSKT